MTSTSRNTTNSVRRSITRAQLPVGHSPRRTAHITIVPSFEEPAVKSKVLPELQLLRELAIAVLNAPSPKLPNDHCN